MNLREKEILEKQKKELHSFVNSIISSFPKINYQNHELKSLQDTLNIANYWESKFLEFRNIFESGYKLLDAYTKIMYNNDFPISFKIGIENIRTIVEESKESDEKIEKIITKIIDEEYRNDTIIEIFREWEQLEFLSNRRPILNNALNSFINNNFNGVILLLISLIDGLIAESILSGKVKDPRPEKDKNNPYIGQNYIKLTGKSILEKQMTWEMMAKFYNEKFMDTYKYGQEIKHSLTRNAIIHGGDLFYGTKMNAIKMIMFFDLVILCFSSLYEDVDANSNN